MALFAIRGDTRESSPTIPATQPTSQRLLYRDIINVLHLAGQEITPRWDTKMSGRAYITDSVDIPERTDPPV